MRSERYKYIRCYDTSLPRGVERGPAQEIWEAHGYLEMPIPEEMLFDLVFDPHEANNLADSPLYCDILQEMRRHLRFWMEETKDPLPGRTIPELPTVPNRSKKSTHLQNAWVRYGSFHDS